MEAATVCSVGAGCAAHLLFHPASHEGSERHGHSFRVRSATQSQPCQPQETQGWRAAALQAGCFNLLVLRQAEHVAQRGLRRRRRDTRARAVGIRRHGTHGVAAAEGAREGLPQRARGQHAAVAERLQRVEHEQRQVAVQRVVLQPVVHQQPAAAHTR